MIKKELFIANITVMEEITAQIDKDIKDAKKVISKNNIREGDINQFVGTIIPIAKQLEEIQNLQNTIMTIHKIKKIV